MDLRRKFLRNLLFSVLLSSLLLSHSPTFAGDVEDGIALAAISTPAWIFGNLVGGLIASVIEVGGYIACDYADPPDIENACTPVKLNPYPAYKIPNVEDFDPTVDPQLISVINTLSDKADMAVALSRAVRTAKDRYEGALLIGEQNCADDRFKDLGIFNGRLKRAGKKFSLAVDNYINVQNSVDPSALETEITKQMVKDVRNLFASGTFPPIDELAISSWELTPTELASMQAAMSNIQLNDIDDVFSTWDIANGNSVSLAFALNKVKGEVLEECYDPNSPLLVTFSIPFTAQISDYGIELRGEVSESDRNNIARMELLRTKTLSGKCHADNMNNVDLLFSFDSNEINEIPTSWIDKQAKNANCYGLKIIEYNGKITWAIAEVFN